MVLERWRKPLGNHVVSECTRTLVKYGSRNASDDAGGLNSKVEAHHSLSHTRLVKCHNCCCNNAELGCEYPTQQLYIVVRVVEIIDLQCSGMRWTTFYPRRIRIWGLPSGEIEGVVILSGMGWFPSNSCCRFSFLTLIVSTLSISTVPSSARRFFRFGPRFFSFYSSLVLSSIP